MNINPKELQKFHDLWAPMISALPAVINAAERANELVNHTAQLQAVLDGVVVATEASKKEAADAVAAAQAQIAALNDQRKELDAEVKEHAKECRKKIDAAKQVADEKIAEHTARANESAETLANSAEQLRVQLQENDRAFLAQKAEHERILAEVEAKRTAAEKALDKLREKLG